MPPRTRNRQRTEPPQTQASTSALEEVDTRPRRRSARSLRSSTAIPEATVPQSQSPTLVATETESTNTFTAGNTPSSESNTSDLGDAPLSKLEEEEDIVVVDTAGQTTIVEMFHSQRTEQHGLRERNVEDLAELEEKGLLRRMTPDGDEEPKEHDSPRLRSAMKGKEKERDSQRILTAEKLDPADSYSDGLSNPRDQKAFALLVLLYLLQGIPLGLTFGTLPFLLKPKLSYSQLGVFSLATWPYSLKLLWAPIVDAWFFQKWGRRKSWIVPVQGIVGIGLWIIGGKVEKWLEGDVVDVNFITTVFGSLILAAATQDIAVDGWALTLLSQPNLSYASTAQTIGIGIGNALSFTVFLAFNSVEFSNKYFRSQPLDYGLVSLGGYIRFWGIVFVLATIGIAIWKQEDRVSEDDPDMDVKKVYNVMWNIFRLKNIQSLLLVHLTCKLGFQVNDSVTGLKLLEKGLSKEDLAVAVLLDFPAQMIAGWLVAKWSRPTPTSSHHPLSGTGQILKPWIYAFWGRLGMALVGMAVVRGFPTDGKVGTGYLSVVVATTLLSSLTSTVQFIGISAFHTHIADPRLGGSFMTLLNTISNLGGTLPKPIILRLVDITTKYGCSIAGSVDNSVKGCNVPPGSRICDARGGHCVITRDGYYIMSFICVTIGTVLLVKFIIPTVKKLQSLPMNAWRVPIPV